LVVTPTWQTADGSIRLFNADCLAVLPTLADASVDCIVTDPPYGHNNNNNGDNPPLGRPIANDGAEANEVFQAFLPHAGRVLGPGCCCCCCCGGGGPDPQFARWSLWMDDAIGFKQMVVWDKGPMGMGWHYRRSYETVLVAEKPGAACRWFDETQQVENIIRPGFRGIRKIIPSADDHPTPKPVALAAHFVGLHTSEGEVVLDPFMGRGWVGVACVRMGRRFIGCEIDAEHFRRAVAKLEDELNRAPLFDEPAVVQRELI
jgi:site-specific DNA-methyltransferase (adenine-specific)